MAVEPYREAWAGLALGSLIALLLQTPAGWLLSLAGWIIGHKAGEGPRRKREIEGVMKQVETGLQAGLASVRQQIVDRVHAHVRQVESRAIERIELFVKDAETQLRSIESGTPLTSRAELDAIAVETNRIHSELQEIALGLGPVVD